MATGAARTKTTADKVTREVNPAEGNSGGRPSANDVLMAGGLPAVTFPEVGHEFVGVIQKFETRRQTDFNSGRPLSYDDGEPMWQVVITCTTPEDEEVNLFVKGQMMAALRTAIRDAGQKGLATNAGIKVTFAEEIPPERKGNNPQKVYTVDYSVAPF